MTGYMLIETLCTISYILPTISYILPTISYILPYPRFPALITLMSAKQQPLGEQRSLIL